MKKIINWLLNHSFPVWNAAVYIFLTWLVATFVTRNPDQVISWCAIGGTVGMISGWLIQRWIVSNNSLNSHRKLRWILNGQFILGLFVIGPFIAILWRFTPVSNLHDICCETPLDYGATTYETINLPTEDGARIAGWYVPPGQQTGKLIILIHGSGYDRRGTDFYTRTLIAAGYGVLLYDLRNHGQSTGKLNVFNRMQVYQTDLSKVIDFLKTKPEVNPQQLGVVGISLGAFTTLNLPSAALEQFSALWLDGLKFENFGAKKTKLDFFGYTQYLFDEQTRRIAGLYTGQPIAPRPPLLGEIIANIKHPQVMIVASGLDPSERQTNETLAPLMGKNKTLWFLDNSWHIGGRFDVPDEYQHKMLNFFAKAFENSENLP